ncbi:hypothetical protein A3K78_06630 [Candidatus Bathyarchaeota archaeon RBG_13_52_12]|nr:MAG: hypothetical protein A3K78_06630 [Candidatus Bathyarchaeota archaeon RBG_13_52_12]
MQSPKTDHIVQAAKELGETFTETATMINGMNGAVKEVNQLYDHGQGGAGNSMISLGIALVVFPEPFMVSDVIGGGIIAAGLLYNKIVSPPLYIDNVFETIEAQVQTIHLTGEDLSENFVPVDFSTMRFEI